MKIPVIPYSIIIVYCILNIILIFKHDKQINQMKEQLDVTSNLLMVHIRNDNLKKSYNDLLEYKSFLDKEKQKLEFKHNLDNNKIDIYPIH
jgi:hypothetical protein